MRRHLRFGFFAALSASALACTTTTADRDVALVTDTGGTTSHPAVLAREFGIPAVIGTSVATHRIVTGDRVRIDGTAGQVEILRDASARPVAGPASGIGS